MKIVAAVAVVLALVAGVAMTQPGLLLAIAKSAERGRASLSEARISVADHEWVYLRGGEGPTVLFVHGFAADKDNWTRLAPHMGGFDLVMPDLPGHGETTRSDAQSYDVRSQVQRLKAFHDELQLGPIHLVGNSMGGHISVTYAATYPDDVRTLTLVNSGGVRSPIKSELTKALEQGFNPLLVQDVADYDRLLAFIFVEPPWIPGVAKTYLAKQAVDHRPFNDKIWGDLRTRPVPLEPLLPTVEAPTLIIWGAQDRVIHPSAAAVFAGGIPDSRTQMMSETGHAPMVERPQTVASLMRPFLSANPAPQP